MSRVMALNDSPDDDDGDDDDGDDNDDEAGFVMVMVAVMVITSVEDLSKHREVD